ncbi:MAG: MFS transporter [Methermicoccaceae archaeon]
MQRLFADQRLRIIFANTLVAVMGVAVLTPAFPEVSSALGVSREQVVMLITAFTLPGIGLAPVLGVLADRVGRKKALVFSLLLFGVAGGTCGLVQSFETILALRFLQGVGGSGLASLSITLIGDMFHGNNRVKAMGLNACVLSVGTASFPLIGGLLTVLSWRAPFLMFFLAIPVGLVVMRMHMPAIPRPETSISAYLTSAFRILTGREMMRFVAGGIIVFIILYGAYLAYFPFLLSRLGAPSYLIGAIMATTSASSAIVSFNIEKVARFLSAQRAIQTALLLAALALLTMPLVHALPLFLVSTVVYGVAQGMATPVLQSFIVGEAPIQYRAIVMGAFSMSVRTGQTVGPLLSAMLAMSLGMSSVFYGAAVLALLGMVLMGIKKR